MYMNHELSTLFTAIILELILQADNLAVIVMIANQFSNSKTVAFFGLFGSIITKFLILKFALKTIEYSNSFLFGIYSMKDIMLFFGGLFILSIAIKSLFFEKDCNERVKDKFNTKSNLTGIFKIIFADIFFSLDSVITAISVTVNTNFIISAFVVSSTIMFFLINEMLSCLKKYAFLEKYIKYSMIFIALKLIAEGLKIYDLIFT